MSSDEIRAEADEILTGDLSDEEALLEDLAVLAGPPLPGAGGTAVSRLVLAWDLVAMAPIPTPVR